MALTDLLRTPSAFRHLLVTTTPYDLTADASVTRRWANKGYVTAPGDSPANTEFRERLAPDGGVSISRSILGRDRLRGIVRPSIGDVRVLSGESGSVDVLDDDADLVWSGRDLTIMLGERDAAFGDFETIFEGRTDGVSLTENELRIALRDPLSALDRPIQTRKFAGTGGVEGPSGLEGQDKPLALGRVRNVEPIALGSVDLGDGALLTFATGDDADGINQHTAVYSNGNALTEVTGAPSAGEWKDWPAKGVFQLGGSEAGTVITADVEGALTSGGTYVNTVADVISLIRDRVASNLSFATNTISDLNSKNSAEVGWWVRDGGRTLDVIAGLLQSIGAYLTTNRAGELVLGRIEAPGTSSVTLDESQISQVRRLNTATPLSSAQVQYQRTWRTHRRSDIASSLSADRTAELQNEWRTTAQKAGVDGTIWPDAQDETFETALDNDADADSEASRLATLFGTQRTALEITVTGQSLLRELGETITVQTDQTGRFGLANGRDLVIVGIEERAPFDATVLTLWG